MYDQIRSSSNNSICFRAIFRALLIFFCLLLFAGASLGQIAEVVETNLKCDGDNYTIGFAYHQATLKDSAAEALHVVLQPSDGSPSKVFGLYIYTGANSARKIMRDDNKGSFGQMPINDDTDIDKNIKKFFDTAKCQFADEEQLNKVNDVLIHFARGLNTESPKEEEPLSNLLVSLGIAPIKKLVENLPQPIADTNDFANKSFSLSGNLNKTKTQPTDSKISDDLRQQISALGASNAHLFNENKDLKSESNFRNRLYLVSTVGYLGLSLISMFVVIGLLVQSGKIGRKRKANKEQTKEIIKLWPPPSRHQIAGIADRNRLIKELTEIFNNAESQFKNLKSSQTNDKAYFSKKDLLKLLDIQLSLLLNFTQKLKEYKVPFQERNDIKNGILDKKSEIEKKSTENNPESVKPVVELERDIKIEDEFNNLLSTVKKYIDALQEYKNGSPDEDEHERTATFAESLSAITNDLKIEGKLNEKPQVELSDDIKQDIKVIKTELETIKGKFLDLTDQSKNEITKADLSKGILDDLIEKLPLKFAQNIDEKEAHQYILKIFELIDELSKMFLPEDLTLDKVSLQASDSKIKHHFDKSPDQNKNPLAKILYEILDIITKYDATNNNFKKIFHNHRNPDNESLSACASRIVKEREQIQDSLNKFLNSKGINTDNLQLTVQVQDLARTAREADKYKSERDNFKTAADTHKSERDNFEKDFQKEQKLRKNLENHVSETEQKLKEDYEKQITPLQDFILKQNSSLFKFVNNFREYLGFKKLTENNSQSGEPHSFSLDESEAALNKLIEANGVLLENDLFRELRLRLLLGTKKLKGELESHHRNDVIKAFHLAEIEQKLNTFIENIEEWYKDNDIWEKGIRDSFKEDSWLHKLLRADRLFKAYYGGIEEMSGLKDGVNDCARAFETAMRKRHIGLIEVELLEPVPRNIAVDDSWPAEMDIKDIREIRALVVKKRKETNNQVLFVVDIKYFGLDGASGVKGEPRVSLLNPGEWPEFTDNN